MFESILIANRGEIACRIMRTAKRLGMRTVAVYSDADRDSLHVAGADVAVRIGPPAVRDSYLNQAAVLQAAAETGAQAIHPGYGFFSENAGFAEACAAAGISFVGPPPSAIRAMGSKSEAKAIMAGAQVPVVPGYHGADQDDRVLANEADAIGYPVMIKASAGGGGKGMRLVRSAADFAASLESARREAASSFGDDRVLIEKFIEHPRHIEMQVFADEHGEVIHLFERDCSLQRRHQKIIEEAPAPDLNEMLRAGMAAAAVSAARAIGYVGAGTVEFIVETDAAGAPADFYFMEMNTRLQVEHPVTEMITGLDLVEWQLRVAAGEALPLSQENIICAGHAVEARLYAEDPTRDFLPATGTLRHLVFPADDANVRVDTGVREGDTVTVEYDPMIAKLIVWDEDRRAALRRLGVALSETEVGGVTTNREFLAALAADDRFQKNPVDTGFIDRHGRDLLPETVPATATVLALATLFDLLSRAAAAADAARRSQDRYSPWNRTDGWRINDTSHLTLSFLDGDDEIDVVVHFDKDAYRLELPGRIVAARGRLLPRGRLQADLDGVRVAGTVVAIGAERLVMVHGRTHRLSLKDPIADADRDEGGSDRIIAPMPGKVIAVHVQAGDAVAAGQPLMVLEAMKMEHTIGAPREGAIDRLHFAEGDQVEEGAELLLMVGEEA